MGMLEIEMSLRQKRLIDEEESRSFGEQLAETVCKKVNDGKLKYCVEYTARRTITHEKCSIKKDKNNSENQKSDGKVLNQRNINYVESDNYTFDGSERKLISDDNQRIQIVNKKVRKRPLPPLKPSSKCLVAHEGNEGNSALSRYSSSCEPVDRDALENMKDNIKSFMTEKANRIRSVVSMTASVFEGEGESNSNEDCFREKRLASEFFHKKKVFLRALCENAHRFQEGKIHFSDGENNFPIRVNSGLNNEKITFESKGLMKNIIFSEMRVSQEMLKIKKHNKLCHRHRHKFKKDSKPKPTEERIDGNILNDNISKDMFLKCDVFESLGENDDTDVRNTVYELQGRGKRKPRLPRNKKCIRSNTNSSGKYCKHYSKFTVCRHTSCLADDSRDIHKSHLHEKMNHWAEISTRKCRKNRRHSVIKQFPLTKEMPLSENNNQCPGETTGNKPLRAQIFHCRVDTNMDVKNEAGNDEAVQFCVPPEGPSLLLHSQSSSVEYSSQKQINICKTKPMALTKYEQDSKVSLPSSKSLDTIRTQAFEKFQNSYFPQGKREPPCRKIMSDSDLNRISEINDNNCNDQQKINGSRIAIEEPKVYTCLKEIKNINIHKEDVYECSSGCSKYLEVKHYVKVRQPSNMSQSISEMPSELVDKYTIDISGLGINNSIESLAMKQKTFDLLLRAPINKVDISSVCAHKPANPTETKATELNSKLNNLEETTSEKNLRQTVQAINTHGEKGNAVTMDESSAETEKPPALSAFDKSKIVVKDTIIIAEQPNFRKYTQDVIENKSAFCNKAVHESLKDFQGRQNPFVAHMAGEPEFNFVPSLEHKHFKSHNKYDCQLVPNGFCTASDIKNMKLKFENNFSSVFPTKNTSETFRQPCGAIMKVLRTSKNKVMSMLSPII